ncbi:transcription termination/antitermination protein NusA [Candidatus Shapirobacteria bacterium CG09_land_8_20_14_0_10_47_13]|uniref:Transcription termination/antitermination protein NusA n=1 Tax=Candidatus Shapirobacteria bacterium CG09_land_8_20_14_0_10_47_13 TaxID=1974481 RepID=A0A2H0WN76_9BACT|nr:MAG: transcription termination/antitermination protein NusA [Candidatus Shapirobacteria bacterium CG09_land_8_20_14_0_10_47_13]
MAILKARTEFASALNQICAEHRVEPKIVLESIQQALLAAFRRDLGLDEEAEYEVTIDPQTGESKIFSWPKEKEKEKKEVTPPGFGRIAAQVAKQVLLQKIREAEKSAVVAEYLQRLGTLIGGVIVRFEGSNLVVDLERTEAIMPPAEQIRSENYRVNQRFTFLLKEIQDGLTGQQIIVSRADPELVKTLFKREVPEVSSGAVEIRQIAREPGNRSKVAVFSRQTGVDPVGSCVGQKGVRVQAVIDEIGGEKIDIIQFSDDPAKFIIAALSPAQQIEVKLDEKNKTAVVSAPEDQLSLAIGREGQNVRLAAKLTGYKIDIQGKVQTPAKPVKKAVAKTTKVKKAKSVKAVTKQK